MKVRHVVGWQKHGIIVCRVEMPECAISDMRLRQGDAALRLEIGDDEFVLLAFIRGRLCGE